MLISEEMFRRICNPPEHEDYFPLSASQKAL